MAVRHILEGYLINGVRFFRGIAKILQIKSDFLNTVLKTVLKINIMVCDAFI